jgi:hypothetical protein
MTQKSKYILLGAAIFVPLAAVIVFIVIDLVPRGVHSAAFYGATFDKARWHAAHQGKTQQEIGKKLAQCIRGAMYGDLRARHLKRGMTKAAVIELIGKPDFGSTGKRDGNVCERWNLGFCSGFKIDLDSLNVCFDKGDAVSHVFRLQH